MSHRRFRAARSLIAVAAILGAALVAPQTASADPPPPPLPLPTKAIVVVSTDQAVLDTLGDVPTDSLPDVLTAAGSAFDVTVSLADDDGNPAAYPLGAQVDLTVAPPASTAELTGSSATLLPGQTGIVMTAAYSQAIAALTITAAVTPTQLPVVDPDDPPTELLSVSATAEAFPVELNLTLFDGDDASLRNGTAGADGNGCAVVDAAHPMCGVVTLPNGAKGGTALTLGLCPAGETCTAGALVTQFLGDLDTATPYTRTAPASMTIFCDRTICGKGGVAHYRAQWSQSADGAFALAPACPAKGVIGPDQQFCTDYVASSRQRSNDLRLVVLFLTDVRGMI